MMIRVANDIWTSISINKLNGREWQVINNVQQLDKISVARMHNITKRMVPATAKEFMGHTLKASKHLLASINHTPVVL
jgi:hypothetical protein